MRGPLTPDELAAVLDDGYLPFDPGHDFHEYDVELIKAMAREIMMQQAVRDALVWIFEVDGGTLLGPTGADAVEVSASNHASTTECEPQAPHPCDDVRLGRRGE